MNQRSEKTKNIDFVFAATSRSFVRSRSCDCDAAAPPVVVRDGGDGRHDSEPSIT